MSLLGLVSLGAVPSITIATADGLILAFSLKGEIVGLSVDGVELVTEEAPALWIRDLSRANETGQPNLVDNPGFENGLPGWRQLVNNRLSVQVMQTQAHGGKQALEFTSQSEAPGFAAYAGEPIPVEAGRRYRVSAWWKSKEGYLSTLSGPPPNLCMDLYREPQRVTGLYLQWLDRRGEPLGDPELAVALHTNANNWRLIQREVAAPEEAAQVQVVIAAKLQNETLWADDIRFIASVESEEPVAGTVEQEGKRLIQTAESNDLDIQVTYEAHDDFIAIHGEALNLRTEDRALELGFALPAVAIGWRFWDDAHRSREISRGGYENAISALFDGWLPISLYPYAGIEDGKVGLALALPPDRPQLALLRYEADRGRFEAVFHLGISPQAVKLENKATFDLLIYRFDAEWGFRSVIAKHVELYPRVYNTDLPIYDYRGAEQGYFLTPQAAEIVREHDGQGIYTAQYTPTELGIKVWPSDAPRPTLEEILKAVDELARGGKPGAAEFAQAIRQSAAIDTNGDWILKHVGIFSWDPGNWEATWAANLDPDLAQGFARWLIAWRIDPAFEAAEEIGAHLDGVQLDNFLSTPAIDFRPEALQNAAHTLTYSPHTYKPGVHSGFAMFDYLQFLRGYLDANWGEDRGISVNFWGLGHPNYLAEFIDAFGGEGNTPDGQGISWNPEILDYRRAVAYHKPLLFANQTSELTEEAARRFRALALLYGVWPRQGPHGTGWSPAVNEIFAETAAVVEQYWRAGWEPMTYARADNPDIWVERFGRDPEEGIFLAVHNRAEGPAGFTLNVDVVALGIRAGGPLNITELVSGEAVPFDQIGAVIRIPGLLERWSTVIFSVRASCPSQAHLLESSLRK
ncbi:MAG: carbohydrate binding domain-containing protein [Candidatus Acetothermia bacterium]|jgi:hypothetical protein|nr:carbohydrate binding domain-containing protein [Candidatus Acetothermia bacterium]MDH7504626.1 carbohydrate binding domain-containing protein [Candidatus Acetothermia bacterium]